MSSELRRLVEAATPGPWELTEEDEKGTCVTRAMIGGWRLILSEGAIEADARLIALAPDLAVLLADAMDALRYYGEYENWEWPARGVEPDVISQDVCGNRARALLARYAELEARAKGETAA